MDTGLIQYVLLHSLRQVLDLLVATLPGLSVCCHLTLLRDVLASLDLVVQYNEEILEAAHAEAEEWREALAARAAGDRGSGGALPFCTVMHCSALCCAAPECSVCLLVCSVNPPRARGLPPSSCSPLELTSCALIVLPLFLCSRGQVRREDAGVPGAAPGPPPLAAAPAARLPAPQARQRPGPGRPRGRTGGRGRPGAGAGEAEDEDWEGGRGEGEGGGGGGGVGLARGKSRGGGVGGGR